VGGKVALITGAARGLGRAYAKRLAGLGAKIAVAVLNLRAYMQFESNAFASTFETNLGDFPEGIFCAIFL
jgi:3-oxoacyl-[acyl-carrier protein] reductase